MGGEGAMASATQSLKQNRALIKKRNIRELKDLLYEKSGKTELEFKKVDAQELEKIKIAIRKEAEASARKQAIAYAISFIVSGGIAFYLSYLVFGVLNG